MLYVILGILKRFAAFGSGEHEKADLTLALLEVLLEGGSGGDGLAGILVHHGIGVTGVGHAAGADVGAVVDGGGDASRELGVEGGGASNEGSENNLHGYRELSKTKSINDTNKQTTLTLLRSTLPPSFRCPGEIVLHKDFNAGEKKSLCGKGKSRQDYHLILILFVPQ
jgi:hypothetical protein